MSVTPPCLFPPLTVRWRLPQPDTSFSANTPVLSRILGVHFVFVFKEILFSSLCETRGIWRTNQIQWVQKGLFLQREVHVLCQHDAGGSSSRKQRFQSPLNLVFMAENIDNSSGILWLQRVFVATILIFLFTVRCQCSRRNATHTNRKFCIYFSFILGKPKCVMPTQTFLHLFVKYLQHVKRFEFHFMPPDA